MMTALRKWFPVFMLISASVKGAFASDVVFNNPDNAGRLEIEYYKDQYV